MSGCQAKKGEIKNLTFINVKMLNDIIYIYNYNYLLILIWVFNLSGFFERN